MKIPLYYLDVQIQLHKIKQYIMASEAQRQFYAGLLALQQDDLEAAETAFDALLAIKKDNPEILVNRGVVALKRNQAQVAINYFTQALGYAPDHIEARNNLAATFIHHDRYENALAHYNVLLERHPNEIEYLYNAGVAEMALGHLPKATTHFEKVLQQNPHHFATLQNRAAIAMRLQKKDEAIDFLHRAIKVRPEDKVCPYMLNALVGDNLQPADCPDYVSHLFDHYALYYDSHMKGALKYELPFQLGRILHELNILQVDNTLDLGCGSGLSGVVLREASKHLTGVDLSHKMLERAREKMIYDELIEQDVIHFLSGTHTQYDLVVALDVLPYIGNLSEFIQALSQRLKTQGHAFFSCEISSDKPWGLNTSARFCHHPEYIRQLIKDMNLNLVYEEKVPARIQEGQPLFEIIYGVTPNF